MTRRRARLLFAASAVALVAVAAAWVAWPQGDGAADLVAVAPIPTTTAAPRSTTTTSAPAAPVPSTTTPAPRPLATPVRVRIPSIGLDAAVVPVGLRSDGQMEVPSAADVGWYRLGPAPGTAGSAVLAAHVDYGGQRGAFFDLRKAPIGAEVLVDGDGTSRRFVVSARDQVAKADVALDRYFTAEGPARLTLITCGGSFDADAGHYDDNIILTALLTP